MEDMIVRLREDLPALKSSFKLVNTKLSTLSSAPTTTELVQSVQDLRGGIKDKTARLAELVQKGIQVVSKEEAAAMDKELVYWSKKATARKRAFDGLMGILEDGMSRDVIYEKAGIEL